MKRVWGHVVAGLSLLAGAGITFSACVHDDTTLFIREALAPQYATGASGCVWTSDPAQVFHSSGVLDVALRLKYDGAFLVGNQMIAQSNPAQLQTETSTITIQGAIVRITDVAGKELRKFTRLTSATIAPASGSTPGYAPVFVTIVDPKAVQESPDVQALVAGAPLGSPGFVRLVTYVRFFGRTLGGQSLESNEFEFPVDVCNGCLINFTNNPNYMVPNCVGNATTTTPGVAQIPCQLGQDLLVDCMVCESNSNYPACRGSYLTAPAPGLDGGSG